MKLAVKKIENELHESGDKRIADHLQRFFKTGKGEYGYGDIFIGIRVPVLRKIAKKYQDISIEEILTLLKSAYHEQRVLAIIMLTNAFEKGDDKTKKRIFTGYLENTEYINNWDIVDISASHIAGAFLFDKEKKTLYDFATSEDMWERRISVIATHYFIKRNEFGDTLMISEILLNDKCDLIHKAVGWMLREVGKRNINAEEDFLKRHYRNMPRVMLRYAIERFEKEKREKYLKGKI